MKQIDASVVILNFNTLALTKLCLESLKRLKLGSFSIEVIVCDNASTDGTEDMVKKEFPDVIFIQNNGNVGFATGNNPGIKRARGRYIVLLNSDTEVGPNVMKSMITFMDSHPKAGAATCKLLLMDGSMDPACHRGFPTPWSAFTYYAKLEKLFPKSRLFGQYHQGYKDLTKPHEVDCISGAFFMVRRDVVQLVGKLDEDFFMYAEDIDWAYRIKKAGWQIWFNPTMTILHKKKQSGRSHIDRDRRIKTQILFITNNKRFYTKHYEHVYPRWVSWLVYRALDIQQWLVQTFGYCV